MPKVGSAYHRSVIATFRLTRSAVVSPVTSWSSGSSVESLGALGSVSIVAQFQYPPLIGFGISHFGSHFARHLPCL